MAVLVATAAIACTPAVSFQAPPEGLAEGEKKPLQIGKLIKRRQIAPVMSVAHADWLTRPERDAEEQPDRVVAALNIPQGATVADLGAGVGYFTWRLAKAVGPTGKVIAVDIQEGMLDLLAANLKRAGLPQEVAGGAKDLFNIDQLPPNVSDENSLFVLSQDACGISAVVRDAWGKDALCLIVSRLSPEELTEKLKFFTGWFSRPSILRYQLQRGDSRLTNKLFTCGEAFLCEADSAESWSLYPTPEMEFLWEEWGFSAAPVPLPPSS